MKTIEAYNYKIGLDVSSLQGGGIITRRELGQIRRDIGALQDPVEKSAAKLDRLRSALNKGGLDASVYAESIRRIKDSYPEAIAAKQRMAEVERQGASIRKSLMNDEQLYRTEVSKTAALVKQGGLTHQEAKEHLRKYRESMPEAIAMQKRLAEAERDAASIRRSLMTDSQRYREEVLRVKTAVRDGGLTHQEAKQQLDAYRSSMPAAVAEQKRLAEAEREVQRITAAGRSDRQLYAAEKQRLAGLVRNHGLAESEARRHLAAYASTLPGVIAAERQRQATLAQVAAIVRQNETAAERYQRQLRELNQLHRSGALDARTYGREMQRMQAEMRSGNAAPAVNAAGMAGMIGQVRTLAAGYLTLQAVTGTFESSFSMENAQKTLEVFTGSVEAGKKLYQDLITLSAPSPISFAAYSSSAQTLLSYNATVQSIIPSLDMLGNIAAGNEERFKRLAFAFGQVTAQGYLQGDELRQLIEGGFNPLVIISKQTGESVTSLKKRMAEGEISLKMVREAMESVTGTGGRFYNLLEERSQTAGGSIAKLKSQTALLRAELGQMFHGDIIETARSLSTLIESIRGGNDNKESENTFASGMAYKAMVSTTPITLAMNTWREYKNVVAETRYEFQVIGAFGTGILTDLANAGENLLRGDWDKVRGAFNGDYTYGLLKEAEAAEKARIAIRDKKEEADKPARSSTPSGLKINYEQVKAEQAEANEPLEKEIEKLREKNFELSMGKDWAEQYKNLNSGASETVRAEYQQLVTRNKELERGKKIKDETDDLQKKITLARDVDWIKRNTRLTDDDSAKQLAELRALGATSTELKNHLNLLGQMAEIEKKGEAEKASVAKRKELEKDAEKIRESLRSPREELAADFAKLSEMYQAGLLAADQYAAAKMRAARELMAVPDDLATKSKSFGDGSEIYAARVEDQNRREKQLLESVEAQRLQAHVNALARTEQQRLNTQRQITDQMRQQAIAAGQMQRPGSSGPAGQPAAGERSDDSQLERIAEAAEKTAAAISNWQIIGV